MDGTLSDYETDFSRFCHEGRLWLSTMWGSGKAKEIKNNPPEENVHETLNAALAKTRSLEHFTLVLAMNISLLSEI